MDLSSAFKSEVFRPLVTILIPGAFAIFPYVLWINGHFPDLATYRDDHEAAYFTIVVLATLAVGMLLDDLGTFVEVFIDHILVAGHPNATREWEEYLRQTFNPEPVGQRYIRSSLLYLKFELSFALCLIPFYIGMLFLNTQREWFSCNTMIGAGIVIVAVIILLFLFAYTTAKVLVSTRRILLRGN